MKNKTYRELKEFIDSLTDEELDQKILFQIAEDGKVYETIYGTRTSEDYYNPDGYGASPASCYDDCELKGIEVSIKKGTIILSADFETL